MKSKFVRRFILGMMGFMAASAVFAAGDKLPANQGGAPVPAGHEGELPDEHEHPDD